MKKSRKFFLNMILLPVAVVAESGLPAQTRDVDSLVARGDVLREEYRFDESAAAYMEALECLERNLRPEGDSAFRESVKDRILLSENGRNMSDFVYHPKVVTRHKFSIEDFFLYFPLEDRGWRPLPNVLDSLSGRYARAVYAPSDTDVIYFSAPDDNGIRNICSTRKKDSLWTLPALLNEQMTSASDEIYPVISADGKRLYFASEGLYGVGGYDLYVSEWDESSGDWSVPVNMGFPYSSPANDLLFADSPDGKFTLFASDRGASRDSVWVYVLEHESVPVRSAVDDPAELAEICRMLPSEGLDAKKVSVEVKSEIPENVDTRKYMERMSDVRALRDSIDRCEDRLSEYRGRYSVAGDGQERKRLEAEIVEAEALIPGYRQRLDEATRLLQEVEMEFLMSGVVIDPDSLLAEAEREVIIETPDYVFSRMSMGEPLVIEVEKPVPAFDYSFKILEKGQFAEDNTIPSGIVYQIQIFSLAGKATVASLKGLTPVFESRSPSGRYIYRVGLFRTYADVLSNLNKVKRLGFKSAFIVGFADGKEIPVKKARVLEAERKNAAPTFYNVTIVPTADDDGMLMEGIRQQASGKDIARVGEKVIVGPFDDRNKASDLVSFVEAMGYGTVKLEIIQTDK